MDDPGSLFFVAEEGGAGSMKKKEFVIRHGQPAAEKRISLCGSRNPQFFRFASLVHFLEGPMGWHSGRWVVVTGEKSKQFEKFDLFLLMDLNENGELVLYCFQI